MQESDVPGYSFLTLQFLIFFEKNKNRPEFVGAHQAFLDWTITNPKLRDFPYVSPGTFLMACYGMLVYPVEFWKVYESDGALLSDLDKRILEIARHLGDPVKSVLDLFESTTPPCDTKSLLRRLRNSVSHAHVAFTEIPPVFTFKDRKADGSDPFEATISVGRLSILLTGLGQFFGSHRETIT